MARVVKSVVRHKATADEFKAGDRRGKALRERVAVEVAEAVADQVAVALVSADAMGARALVAERIRDVSEAERRRDDAVLRGAWVDLAVAAAACAAQIDFEAGSVRVDG